MKNRIPETSSELTPEKPSKRRQQILSSSSPGDSSPGSEPVGAGKRKRPSTKVPSPSPLKKKATETSDSDEIPEDFQMMFPNRSAKELKRILDRHDGDVDLACDEIFNAPSSSSPALPPVFGKPEPAAKSSGSKKKRKVIVIADDDEADEGDDGLFQYPHSVPVVTIDDSSSPVQSELGDVEDESERTAVDFFNSCTLSQLSDLTQASEEQHAVIVTLRPFRSYSDLSDKLSDGDGLSTRLLDKYFSVRSLYQSLDNVMSKCVEISSDMTSQLQKWTDMSNSTSGAAVESTTQDGDTGLHIVDFSDRVDDDYDEKAGDFSLLRSQPALLNSEWKLKNYQLVGMNWLLLLHYKKVGGILADSMGLGKTAQVIAFMAHLLSIGESGPYLIVVPSSIVDNWLRELNNWCPALSVVSYYGSQTERLQIRMNLSQNPDFNIIITTYNIIGTSKVDRVFLRSCGFAYMILDEGHMVKNTSSQRYKHLSSIKSAHRILLTGTPLQNNLQELMALLMFIMPTLVSGEEENLNALFSMQHDADSQMWRDRVEKAKIMMAPFILRRRKDDVLKDLPAKIHRLVHCKASTRQRALYNELLQESKAGYQADIGSKSAAVGKRLNNILMQLRKMACHPLLHRKLYTDDKLRKISKLLLREQKYWDCDANVIFEDMEYMSDFEIHSLCDANKSVKDYALSYDMLKDCGKITGLLRLLKEIKDSSGRVLIFSQFTIMLDVLQAIFTNENIVHLRLDGQTPVLERQALIDQYTNDDEIFVFLLSTKAGGFGINLTAANNVIMYDLDFNPQNDSQAEDRAHRVGQTRDVIVTKLITEGTIEEQIYQCGLQKMKLDKTFSSSSAVADGNGDDGGDNAAGADVSTLMEILKAELK